MSVNFDELPNKNPGGAVAPPGFYKFTVMKPAMRQPNDAAKPEYLNYTLALSDINGKKYGNMFDAQYDSDTKLMQFKLGRFVAAIGLKLKGKMDLKDLAKLIENRSGVVEVANVPNYKDATRTDATVKIYGSDCYWPLSEFAKLVAGTAPDLSTPDADDVIEFSDEDSPVPPAPAAPPAADEY